MRGLGQGRVSPAGMLGAAMLLACTGTLAGGCSWGKPKPAGPLEKRIVAAAKQAREASVRSRPDLAVRTWRGAIDRAKRLDDRLREAVCRSNLAAVYLDLGRPDQAARELEASIAILEPSVSPEGHARGEAVLGEKAARAALLRARIHMASARIQLGALDAAASELAAARALAGRSDAKSSEVDSALYGAEGSLARRRGDLPAAREAFRRALDAAEHAGDSGEAARSAAIANLARLSLDEGLPEEAFGRFEEVLGIDRAREDVAAIAWDLEGMGRAAESLAASPEGVSFLFPHGLDPRGSAGGDPGAARRYAMRLYRRAYDVASGVGLAPVVTLAARALQRLHEQLGEEDTARRWRDRAEAPSGASPASLPAGLARHRR